MPTVLVPDADIIVLLIALRHNIIKYNFIIYYNQGSLMISLKEELN